MSVKTILAASLAVLIPALLLVAIAVAGFLRSGQGHEVFSLEGTPSETAHAYRFVEAHPDAMRQVPCYCGCGSLGHESLLECFVTRSGGYEPHASNCAICGREAADVEAMLGRGESAALIRSTIDADYAKYGRPTDTPSGQTK